MFAIYFKRYARNDSQCSLINQLPLKFILFIISFIEMTSFWNFKRGQLRVCVSTLFRCNERTPCPKRGKKLRPPLNWTITKKIRIFPSRRAAANSRQRHLGSSDFSPSELTFPFSSSFISIPDGFASPRKRRSLSELWLAARVSLPNRCMHVHSHSRFSPCSFTADNVSGKQKRIINCLRSISSPYLDWY